MKAYVFPGQGSQKVGMGEDLFDEFKDLCAIADSILEYSIKDLCLEDVEKSLNLTQFTQPALFIVNALSYYKKIKEGAPKPDFVAGHSLGEYNALLAAEAFDFETGVQMVQKRGALMSRAPEGAMAAVIGLSEEKIKDFLKANNLEAIDIANYNSPSQIVISGLKEDIKNARPIFKAEKIKCIPLKVSAAFHSRYMNGPEKEFRDFIIDFNFSDLNTTVVSNVEAKPYQSSTIKENLTKQISHSVRWTDSVRFIADKGDVEFEEIGPGTVLKGLIDKILA